MLLQSATPTIPSVLEGVKIFPCVKGWKDPYSGTRGWYDATNDLEQITSWAQQHPGCNWGIATGLSGYLVFDIDPDGMDWWHNLLAERADIRRVVDRTFQVRTPRGGYHIYFRGEGPSTSSRIVHGVDTRGGIWRDGRLVSGGYVVMPGSHTVEGIHPKTGKKQVEGDYTPINYLPVQPLPPELLALIPERASGTVHGLEKSPEKDQPRNLQWAVSLLEGYVSSGRVSVMGQGGNDLAFRVAASILDKAISPGTCYELLMEHWNPHCSPPWDDWELERIVRNAAEYADDAATGAKGFQANEDVFAKFAGQAEEPAKPVERKHRVQWIHEYAASVQDPSWLLPGFIPAQGTGIMYGKRGTYKSFIALDMAATLAHGIAGQWGAAPVQHDVLFLAGEMPNGTARLRYPAWAEWRERNPTEGRLAILPGVPQLHNREAWEGIKLDMDALQMRPSLVIVDTLSRLMTGLDENTAKDAVMTISFMEDLARYYECFVLAVHHEGKDASREARGSSVLIDNPDMAIQLKKQGNGVEMRIKKQKDIDIPEDPYMLQVKPVGTSIVLERTENLVEAPVSGPSKIDWLEKDYIMSILVGGKRNTDMLAHDISLLNGVAVDTVRSKLRKANHLKVFRSGDVWEIPTLEYDL